MGKTKRESSIELLRIYACTLVVIAHIQIGYTSQDEIIPFSFVFKLLMGDDVPIFFAILGFFLFQKIQKKENIKDVFVIWWQKIKGFLLHIFLPTIVVTLIACFGSEYFYHRCSFTELFTKPQIHWEYLTDYLKGKPSDMVGHFWYIVSYVKILVLFPILSILLCWNKKWCKYIRYIYIVFGLIWFALSDLQFLKIISQVPDIKLPIFDYNYLYVILGFEAWQYFERNKDNRKKQFFVSFFIMFMGIFHRFALTMSSFQLYGMASNDHFLILQCVPAFLSSVGTLMFFYAVFYGIRNSALNFLGNMTFYVYMVHGIMLRVFSEAQQKILVKNMFGSDSLSAAKYYLAYGFIIIGSSFIFGLCIKYILILLKHLLYSFIRRIKKKK